MRLQSHALFIILLSGLAFACSGRSGGAPPLPTGGGEHLPGGDEEIFRLPNSPDGGSEAGGGVKHGNETGIGDDPSDEPSPVPEPGTLLIVGSGLAILGTARRKRLRKRRQEQQESS